jgi:Sodium/hydrogen exchanger family
MRPEVIQDEPAPVQLAGRGEGPPAGGKGPRGCPNRARRRRPGTARRLRAAVLGPHGGRPTRCPASDAFRFGFAIVMAAGSSRVLRASPASAPGIVHALNPLSAAGTVASPALAAREAARPWDPHDALSEARRQLVRRAVRGPRRMSRGSAPGAAVAELAPGLAVGVAVGGAGGWLVRSARRRGRAAEGFAGAAVLGLAVCAYASAVALDGNGFIAAFVGGLAFGAAAGRRGKPLVLFVEETGALVPLLVWLAFGAAAITPALEGLTWQLVMYAVLSLTVIRMAPVALAPAGAGLGRRAAAFIGWLGPRGLASVVFALLALEDLGEQVPGPR